MNKILEKLGGLAALPLPMRIGLTLVLALLTEAGVFLMAVVVRNVLNTCMAMVVIVCVGGIVCWMVRTKKNVNPRTVALAVLGPTGGAVVLKVSMDVLRHVMVRNVGIFYVVIVACLGLLVWQAGKITGE